MNLNRKNDLEYLKEDGYNSIPILFHLKTIAMCRFLGKITSINELSHIPQYFFKNQRVFR